MLFWSILIVLAALALFKYFQFYQVIHQTSLPGPKPVPFIGNIHQLFGTPSLWIKSLEWLYEYGDIIQAFFFTRRVIIIGGNPEAIKDVFSDKEFIKGVIAKAMEEMLGKTGMVFSDGESWARVRKICAGAFNIQHLKVFYTPMKDCTAILSARLARSTSSSATIRVIDMDQMFMLAALDVIGRTMFSVDFQALESAESRISKEIGTYLKEGFARIMNPLNSLNPWAVRRRKAACSYILSYMNDIISARIRDHGIDPTSKTEIKDLLDLLLDASDPDTGAVLTQEEIRDQVVTFLFAGHETTAHSLAFTLASIAQNPHIARKVYQEVDEVMINGSLEYEDIGKMTYLTAVIKEAMRMNPVVGSILRQLDEDKQIGSCSVPKGSLVGVNMLAVHYSHQLWKNPMEFNPDRFLSPDAAPLSFLSYNPFGHGKRSCIGQHFAMLEMRLILASILHKFRFELLPLHPVAPVQHFTFRPKALPMTVWLR